MLDRESLEDIGRKVKDVAAKDAEQIKILCQEVRNLQIKKLEPRPCYSIASVAADGGENQLSFSALGLRIIRVSTNTGEDLVRTVVSTVDRESLEEIAEKLSVLQSFSKTLKTSIRDISYLLGSDDLESKSNYASRVKALRELIEWAVFTELALKKWDVDVILMRDGLLRTKVIKRDIFPYLDRLLRNAYQNSGKRRIYLAGVAKTSVVISKLSLALDLEGIFNRPYSCYLEVPYDLEKVCYNFERTWLDTIENVSENGKYQSFGRLHLVKLSPLPDAPVYPVDVPVWYTGEDRQRTLEYLAYDSRDTFPNVGYPYALQQAHENAKITGFELDVLADEMVQGIIESLGSERAETVLRHLAFGRFGKGIEIK